MERREEASNGSGPTYLGLARAQPDAYVFLECTEPNFWSRTQALGWPGPGPNSSLEEAYKGGFNAAAYFISAYSNNNNNFSFAFSLF